MNKFGHVMVALAFGDDSEGIFRYVAEMAKRLEARLSLVSIVRIHSVPTGPEFN